MADILNTWERIGVWQKLISADGRFHLVLQSDGNLVLYREPQHVALWASNTVGRGGTYVVMQGDANLVLYRDDHRPVWASGRLAPIGNYLLRVQNDGNVVVYRDHPAGTAIWATNTVQDDDPGPGPGPILSDYCCTVVYNRGGAYSETLSARSSADAWSQCMGVMLRELGDGYQVRRGACDTESWQPPATTPEFYKPTDQQVEELTDKPDSLQTQVNERRDENS